MECALSFRRICFNDALKMFFIRSVHTPRIFPTEVFLRSARANVGYPWPNYAVYFPSRFRLRPFDNGRAAVKVLEIKTANYPFGKISPHNAHLLPVEGSR